MTEDIDLQADLERAVELGKERVERLKSDPDSVRKLLLGEVVVDEKVTVYPDRIINGKFAKFQEELQQVSALAARRKDESDDEYVKRVEPYHDQVARANERLEEIQAEVEESGVTFHLYSIGKKAVKNLRKAARALHPDAFDPEADPLTRADAGEDLEEYYQASIVAAHLVKDGYTVSDILNIKNTWPDKCFLDLLEASHRLSVASEYVEVTTDPDFS